MTSFKMFCNRHHELVHHYGDSIFQLIADMLLQLTWFILYSNFVDGDFTTDRFHGTQEACSFNAPDITGWFL